MKRNIGKAIERIRYSVLPLIPRDIIDTLRAQLNNQTFVLCFEAGADIEQALSLRRLQISNERNPS